MKKSNVWLKHVLTDYDNTTYDTGRCLALGYFVCAVVFTGINMWKGQAFDVGAFLSSGGAYLAGLGIYIFGDAKGKQNANSNDPSVVQK